MDFCEKQMALLKIIAILKIPNRVFFPTGQSYLLNAMTILALKVLSANGDWDSYRQNPQVVIA